MGYDSQSPMRRTALLFLTAVVVLSCSCSSQRLAVEGAITSLKCGGPGGERNFSACTWRKTSVFSPRYWKKPQPQKRTKGDPK